MTTETQKLHHIPNQLRWNPFDLDEKVDWVHGLHLIAGSGDPTLKQGLGILLYAAGKDMGKEAFYSADGDFLIVPQHGVLDIQTELGRIILRPNEICVIPRGVRYVHASSSRIVFSLTPVFQISSNPPGWPCAGLHL